MAPRQLLLTLLAAVALRAADAQEPAVRVDPRIELTTIVFRLIGADEYNQCQLSAYAADIDRHFASFREHPALKLAAELREAHNIGFDAVPHLALALTDPPELAERLDIGPDGRGLGDDRWAGPHAREFIAALRQFASDSRFIEFFSAHRPLYDATEVRLRTFLAREVRLPWYPSFFGEPPSARFFAIPGMCNGGANYGPRIQPRSGAEERYAVLGMSGSDSTGVPVISLSGLPTIIHEFGHSFVNPPVTRHIGVFRGGGERLLADSTVRRMMAQQAYSDWPTIIKESLVRAAVVRYLGATRGDSARRSELAAQYGRGFLWIGALDSSLAVFERSRQQFPHFEDYLPRLAEVFDQAADALPAAVAAFNAARPRIVSTTPADGATDLAATDSLITVRFDRPMGRGVSISRDASGRSAYPEILRSWWDSTRTILTLRVVLAPATAYQMLFTGGGFRSLDGVPLLPRAFRFTTR